MNQLSTKTQVDFNDYPTTLSGAILRFAEELRSRSLSPEISIEKTQPIPKSIDTGLASLTSQYQRSLLSRDYQNFKGYFSFLKPAPASINEGIARVKLAHDLSDAFERLRLKQYIAIRKGAAENPIKDLLPAPIDKEGLVDISVFDKLPDALTKKDAVFYLDAHIPFNLQTFLLSLGDNSALTIRTGILSHVVSRASYAQRFFEAREWGRPFNNSELVEVNKDHSALSVYGRYPKSELESLTMKLRRPVLRLEVLRTEKPHCLSFMFEELLPIPQKGIIYLTQG